MAKRKRGGQPDNTNALKHGFYSRRFNQVEVDDLKAILEGDQAGLQNEINMLRVAMQRVFHITEHRDPDIATRALATLSNASARVGGLMRLQMQMGQEGENEVLEALNTAIVELIPGVHL